MPEFEVRLRAWLRNQGFDCDLVFDEDFGYDWKDNILHVGIFEFPTVGRWFEQFMCEYGLEWCGIYDPVLALIHELGHYSTNEVFCAEEIYNFQFIKALVCDDCIDEQAAMFRYWEVGDEFEANMWAVDFINWNIDAVKELIAIYFESWEGVKNVF